MWCKFLNNNYLKKLHNSFVTKILPYMQIDIFIDYRTRLIYSPIGYWTFLLFSVLKEAELTTVVTVNTATIKIAFILLIFCSFDKCIRQVHAGNVQSTDSRKHYTARDKDNFTPWPRMFILSIFYHMTYCSTCKQLILLKYLLCKHRWHFDFIYLTLCLLWLMFCNW